MTSDSGAAECRASWQLQVHKGGRSACRLWNHILVVKPMKLISPSEFSLKLIRPLTDQTMPQSEIVIRGEPTGKLIDGAILEATVGWDGCYLAFATDDIPHEDTLRIYLFDSRLKLIDSATLGGMYSTGSFGHLELSPPNMLSFAFIGDTTWVLELLGREELALPFIGDPEGVSRPFAFHRRFRIYGQPKPETGS